eukprot:3919265-Prymnesium_polylepis.1
MFSNYPRVDPTRRDAPRIGSPRWTLPAAAIGAAKRHHIRIVIVASETALSGNRLCHTPPAMDPVVRYDEGGVPHRTQPLSYRVALFVSVCRFHAVPLGAHTRRGPAVGTSLLPEDPGG